MKILLAPSESKRSGGEMPFELDTLLLNDVLHDTRMQLLSHYRNLVNAKDTKKLATLFGLKKESEIARYTADPTFSPSMKAILRYDGVAFDHLDYLSLETNAQTYIDTHVILFSNLFGPIRANDAIPEYKLKQGAALDGIKPEKRYKEMSQKALDAYLDNDDILDLRAGFYDKFYKPSFSYTVLKFLKNGKSVSHWAKAYRGKVTRACAEANIETLDEFVKLPIDGLEIVEIQTKGNRTEIVYAITE